MSYKLTHNALHAANCSGLTKFVLVALADYASENGECYPAQGTIANLVGCSRQAVVSAINQLEKIGYLTRLAKHRLTLVYRLNIPTAGGKPNCVNQDDMSTRITQSQPVNVVDTTCQPGLHNLSTRITQPVNVVDTNRSKNREENQSINQEEGGRPDDDDFSSSSDSPEAAEEATPQPPSAPPKKRCHEVAIDRLVARGESAEVARQKVLAVRAEYLAFRDAVKANGELAKQPNRNEYLVSKLVEMALKGPQASRPATPPPPPKKVNENTRDLNEILNILREEFAVAAEKAENPLLAKTVRELLAREALDAGEVEEWDNLKAIAEAGWQTARGPVNSPLGYARKTLSQIIEARAEAAAEEDRAADIATLRALNEELADVKDPLWYADHGQRTLTADKRAELTKQATELQARVDTLKKRLVV